MMTRGTCHEESDMRRINAFGVVLALLFVASAVAVVYAAWSERQSNASGASNQDKADKLLPYVTAPGYMFPHTIHWIDDDNILYLGGSAEEYEELWTKRLFSVRIWNWRTGEVRDVDRAASEHICFDGDVVRYAVQLGDVVVYRQGPLGATSDVSFQKEELTGEAQAKRGERRHPFYCREYKLGPLGPEANCRIPLRDGDGLLDATGRRCRPAERSELERLKQLDIKDPSSIARAFSYQQELLSRPVEYFTNATAEPIRLPLAARELTWSGYGIHYSWFSDAYVVRAMETATFNPRGHWPEGVPVPFYVIQRGGSVRRYEIPWDMRLGGKPADAQLTRTGLILLSSAIRRSPGPGDAGLYLQKSDGKAIRIFSAVSQEMRVSPNGCYVAVHSEHMPKGYPRNVRGRLSVLEVC